MSAMFDYQEAVEYPTQQDPSFKSAWDREKYYLFNPTPFMVWMYTKFPFYAVMWLLLVAVACENIHV